MKLFYSFIKELKLASRGFYFYIEIFMALLILSLFLFVVPDNFNSKTDEYLHLDIPEVTRDIFLEDISSEDIDGQAERVEINIDDVEKEVIMYETPESEVYLLDSREDVIYMADEENKMGAVIGLNESGEMEYDYYLQGYESDRYRNFIKILHVESTESLLDTMDNREVRELSESENSLTDKENTLPSVLVFNGSLMGLFIIAAYIFLDRQEGVIKAYALTPSPVWQYLMSKVLIIMVTSVISSFIVLIPIMGLGPNYLLLLVLLISTGFFSSSLGLLIASFYNNIMQAFGAIYTIMVLMIIPNIAYFMPSWNPSLVKVLPTYPMLEGFKSVLLGEGDYIYVLGVSAIFLAIGMILFLFSNIRYKKTLIG